MTLYTIIIITISFEKNGVVKKDDISEYKDLTEIFFTLQIKKSILKNMKNFSKLYNNKKEMI